MPLSLSNCFSSTKRGWELTVIALRQWWEDDAFRLASSLAFYTVFSLAPILLITVALASIIFSEQEAKRLVIEQIDLMTGSEGAHVAGQVMNNLSEIGRSTKAIFVGITTVLFAMIYKYLPDVRINWDDVFIGAAITAGLFSVGKFMIGLYLGRTAIGSTYGAAGSFVVLLIWIYYSALICFLGAEFTQVYARRYGSRIRPEPHAVRIDSEA